jgi:RNA polymerase sigma-70 factor, ECF subfamily
VGRLHVASNEVRADPFTEDLASHGAGLYRFALSITRDPALAADLVQDTFVRAIERSDQYRGDAPLGAWLRRILHNLAIDRVRRASHELVVEEVEDAWMSDEYTVDPEATAMRAQTADELLDALLRIPFIYRSAVTLHDVDGWTVREIAEVHDIGIPAAKQRLRRGRMALVTALAEGHERRKHLEGVPMRCWDARVHVSDYLNGTLDRETATLVETHLEVCPTCPPLYAALVDASDRLSTLRDDDAVVPPDLEAAIHARLSGTAPTPSVVDRPAEID